MRFINMRETVRVDVDLASYVTILPKMSAGVVAAYQRDMTRIEAGAGGGVKISTSAMTERLALLKHNITGWHGPAFIGDDGKSIRFSAEALESLDPTDPAVEAFIETVYAAVNARNQPKVAEGDDSFLSDDSSS